METIDATEIVRKTGMSDNPGFYSGRGATTSDLDDKKLEKIYQHIKHLHGLKTAEQFVQMVADIPKLTATDFLCTLYNLEAHEWKWDRSLLGNQRGIYPTSEGSAFGTVVSVLYGLNSIDDTQYIRDNFLRRHGL